MIFFAMLIACFPIPQSNGSEQAPDPVAKSVLEEFVVAKGGETAIRKIKNASVKGNVFSKNVLIGEFESYQAANCYLSIIRFPDGSTRRSGTNGKIAWRIDVDGKPTLMKGQEARDYIRYYQTMHPSLEWQKQFDVILYAGKKTVQGSETHHLIFVASDNRQINRYFSVESGLLTREEQVIGTDEDILIQVSELGDYVRQENGVVSSRRRVNHLNHLGSKYSVEFRTDSVETNTITDESVFAVPDPVVKLVDAEADQGMSEDERAQTELKLFKQIEKGMSEEAVYKLLKDFKADRGGSGFVIDTYHLSDQTTVKIWYNSGVMAVKHEEDWIIGGL